MGDRKGRPYEFMALEPTDGITCIAADFFFEETRNDPYYPVNPR
jgi:hypothetical protein